MLDGIAISLNGTAGLRSSMCIYAPCTRINRTNTYTKRPGLSTDPFFPINECQYLTTQELVDGEKGREIFEQP